MSNYNERITQFLGECMLRAVLKHLSRAGQRNWYKQLITFADGKKHTYSFIATEVDYPVSHAAEYYSQLNSSYLDAPGAVIEMPQMHYDFAKELLDKVVKISRTKDVNSLLAHYVRFVCEGIDEVSLMAMVPPPEQEATQNKTSASDIALRKLAEWERKLKVAKGKVAKYKKSVNYHAKKGAYDA